MSQNLGKTSLSPQISFGWYAYELNPAEKMPSMEHMKPLYNIERHDKTLAMVQIIVHAHGIY